MTTDRELLQLAAKAAGLRVWQGKWPQDDMLFASPKSHDPSGKVTGVEWNPLTDDGDALRLVVQCELEVSFVDDDGESRACCAYPDANGLFQYLLGNHKGDIFAETRRVIVRAAAQVGEAKND